METIIGTALCVIGIAGIFIRNTGVRTLLWVIALFSFGIGLLALIQGGIAEPFAPEKLFIFCSVTFWPLVGCIIGQFLIKQLNKKI